ncbi:transposase [Candidatus Protofrankia datiscae]|uniref:transposase n=1 Tax=Candidatus Protofrankia datiscae TaxID=2716812 RepID=UPI0013EF4277|nr:transposase [Candidatus Protofrankia datiscae]
MESESQERPGRSSPPRDPAPRPSRRVFSTAYKLRIVAEYENAPHGEKGAILRREGLFSSHVVEWTRARDAGALGGKPGAGAGGPEKKPVKSAEQIEVEKLRRENERLKARLVTTETALDIMGKARALGTDLRERGHRKRQSRAALSR